ncbi:unnamed protein product (macronuclear) [Paramecium tetraurelia]|uniref:Uncharacterized protein n=1 Tax=Paramecium tetraurelia TaxID=5888 RepID=A0DVX5_PARTE|nr:uncharacterized protein GSPATT00020845001 [Paramecium tetraurelia]CAK87192.1 unnamed protein product [Paramecium tetraurelia]|eukprot:XP_001454589.1 hypothetical protein (macronuclear) [Paramecium tetraurelia strain d4-2]
MGSKEYVNNIKDNEASNLLLIHHVRDKKQVTQQLQQAPFPDCKGIFYFRIIRNTKDDECKLCKGYGNVEGVIEIEIPIDKGISDGYCVKLYGKGNLFYWHTMSLKEALVGVKVINITTHKRKVSLKWTIYIEFPKDLDQNAIQKLAEVYSNIIHLLQHNKIAQNYKNLDQTILKNTKPEKKKMMMKNLIKMELNALCFEFLFYYKKYESKLKEIRQMLQLQYETCNYQMF